MIGPLFPLQRNVNNIVAEVQQFQKTIVETLRERVRDVFDRHDSSGNFEHLRNEAMASFDTFPDPRG